MAEPNALVKKEPAEVTAAETTRGGIHYTPRVDIYENSEELVFLCDLPGVKPSNIELRFENGELGLYGKVRPRQPAQGYLADEYGVGDFYRSFSIPIEINADKISADCKHGVLSVHLPKAEKIKPRRIAIKAE